MLPTLDKPLARFFGWYGGGVLVDYYQWFIAVPLVLSVVLGTGFMRMNELAILDARVLFTPLTSPSWHEEKVISELWPLRPYEFLPERTFEWNRFFYIIIFARRLGADGQTDNLLTGDYLEQIDRIENDITTNVTFRLDDSFKLVNVSGLNGSDKRIGLQEVCLNWYGDCYRQSSIVNMLKHKELLESRGIAVTYPRANTAGTPIYLAFNLGGVETNPANDTIRVVRAMRL